MMEPRTPGVVPGAVRDTPTGGHRSRALLLAALRILGGLICIFSRVTFPGPPGNVARIVLLVGGVLMLLDGAVRVVRAFAGPR